MKTDNRQQLLVIVAVAAIVLLVGDRMILSPLTKSWKERSGSIAELRQKIAQGQRLLERDRSIHDRWNVMNTNALPASASAAEQQVVSAFDRWSRDSRISISSIKPNWKRLEDDYATLECRVDASGSMSALTRFIYDLEKDPSALKVDLVEITSRDDNGRLLGLTLQVSGLQLKPVESAQ